MHALVALQGFLLSTSRFDFFDFKSPRSHLWALELAVRTLVRPDGLLRLTFWEVEGWILDIRFLEPEVLTNVGKNTSVDRFRAWDELLFSRWQLVSRAPSWRTVHKIILSLCLWSFAKGLAWPPSGYIQFMREVMLWDSTVISITFQCEVHSLWQAVLYPAVRGVWL